MKTPALAEEHNAETISQSEFHAAAALSGQADAAMDDIAARLLAGATVETEDLHATILETHVAELQRLAMTLAEQVVALLRMISPDQPSLSISDENCDLRAVRGLRAAHTDSKQA